MSAGAAARGLAVVGAINVDLVVSSERLPGPGETVVGRGPASFGGAPDKRQGREAGAELLGPKHKGSRTLFGHGGRILPQRGSVPRHGKDRITSGLAE